MIFYTNRFIPEFAAACARGPFIFIRPEYKDDLGLKAHEMEHVKQWLFTLGLHSILYLLFSEYRLWAEVDAYKVQAEYYPDDRKPLFAQYIATKYKLNITKEDALKLLKEG